MSVSITDPDGGDVDVLVGGSETSVVDTMGDIDVIVGGGVVTIRKTELWIMLKLHWNGGTTSPTILEFFTTDGVILEGNIQVNYWGDVPSEWELYVDFYASGPPRNHIAIQPTPGDTLQQATFRAYTEQGEPNDFRRVTFVTKDSSGTPTNPPAGNVCWLTFGPL
jgi:hypothetical protein